ncbi:hypothetical protein TIFTF001_050034 [Ficus carica]|uniref:Uncharacterized protein n=1 Tax=Ficus carica TaxID=3494 RepID=A0AA88CKW1_FICCA|nr:hypothetical protein TIFTF001_050034 [Ficus carica]
MTGLNGHAGPEKFSPDRDWSGRSGKPASKLHSLVFRTGLIGQAVRTDLTGAGQVGLKIQGVRTDLTGPGQAGSENQRVQCSLVFHPDWPDQVRTGLTGTGQACPENQ